jgi:hypothetical protein
MGTQKSREKVVVSEKFPESQKSLHEQEGTPPKIIGHRLTFLTMNWMKT